MEQPQVTERNPISEIDAQRERELRDFETLKTFDPVHEWSINDEVTIRLMLRVVENRRGKRFLDLREYQLGVDARSGTAYEGFTKRGIRVGVHEADRLQSLLRYALEIMRTPPKKPKT